MGGGGHKLSKCYYEIEIVYNQGKIRGQEVKIERIDHINIWVEDLKEGMKFFSELMGTKFVGPINMGDNEIAFDKAGLELAASTTGETPEELKKNVGPGPMKEGIFGIGLRVPNLDEAIAELEAKGIKCNYKTELPGIKAAQFSAENTHGVWFELVEYDVVPPVSLANIGSKTKEVPFYPD
jgi:catechol 2,3-dioxygenase-like lactoylglutathione lyase family enzyme